jgi:hypothetical protein
MNELRALGVCFDLVCRERITQYEMMKKPDLVEVWKQTRINFRDKKKMLLNSWAGDLFAKCCNELGIQDYENLVKEYFVDNG